MKILIINDDPICQEALKSLLIDNCSCKVDMAFSSTEAFNNIEQKYKSCHKSNYDIIFVDIHLSDVEGYEFIGILNKLGLEKRARIIAITVDEKFDQRLCLENGISTTIIKPITLKNLRQLGII